jgi:glutathione-specific gamma-glutamylcyclotransferase
MPNTNMSERDPAPMLEHTLKGWQNGTPEAGLWVFGYASLIWRPEFEFTEKRAARVQGWHRALHMWSRLNRGTPECPGLVFAMLSGGSCRGAVFHVPQAQVPGALEKLWEREMPTGVYDPRWLRCATPQGDVRALAFTLSRRSPSFCGELTTAQYAQIFSQACGRYGSTLDYAQQTYDGLLREGIHDRALQKLLLHAC